MIDRVRSDVRSKNMAAIKSKNTKPEILVRKALFSRGFRYRMHVKELPGSPDLVFKSRKAIILVDGCFWHGHECGYVRLPLSNSDYWFNKIERNKRRDELNIQSLLELGWRVCRVWECAVKYGGDEEFFTVINKIEKWLLSNERAISFQRIRKDNS